MQYTTTTTTVFKMSSQGRPWIALLSGTLGATASCLAKFALAPDSSAVAASRKIAVLLLLPVAPMAIAEYLTRGLFVVLMLACNALMLGTFVEGMQESGSVAGTALSSAANFGVSALYGYLWFEERECLNRQWWWGLVMVMVGVALLSSSSSSAASPSHAAIIPTTKKEPQKQD